MTVFGQELVPLVKRVVKETLDDNVLGLAAETAWSFFFGLFPSVLFALPLLSLIGDRGELVQSIMNQISLSLPGDTAEMIGKIIMEIVNTDSAPGLISIGLVLALWSGSSMFASLMTALNKAYEIRETRPWWRQRLIAAGCTVGGVGILWLSTIIMIGGEQIVQLAVRFLRLDPAEAVVLAVVQYTLAFVLLATFIWVLYLVLPAGTQNKRTSIIGAMVATILWMVFTLGFRLYVQNFDAYNKAYGVIGAVMVLLTWMYWTMFVILVGGELNSEFEQKGPPSLQSNRTGAIEQRNNRRSNH